ncbi:WXG100 family type VII secretion target [Amycolatopsis nigrescens]|uniref:WXG100 family type VII secretion target n=1 Tax=Amycolatopsis nigrescens TaxID=381445 RepID=UPI00039A58D5|nr:hypothetical protein [Amycolatopsis nigrescens]
MSAWTQDMEEHSGTFRAIWKQYGAGYLMFGTDNPPVGFDTDDPTLEDKMNEVDGRIRDLYADFCSGEPSEAKLTVESLGNAISDIRENFHEHLDGMDIYLEDWSGDASDNFREYLNQMKDALNRKQDCLEAAKGAIQAYHDFSVAFRGNILDLVEQTQAALDQVKEEEEARSERKKLAILSACVTVGAALAAIPTAGASMGAAMAAVGASLVAGGAGVQAISVGGNSRGEVIANMLEEGDKIVKDAIEAKGRVEQALFKVTTFVTDVKGSNLQQVRPDRPQLITDEKFDPEGFHPDGQSKEDRKGVGKGDLVAEPDKADDEKRDHYIQDPSDQQWEFDGPFGLPKLKDPERGPDAYEEQGPVGERAR